MDMFCNTEAIREELAPVIAKHGVRKVILAIADRLREDAEAVQHRGPGGQLLSVDLDCLGGALREALETYASLRG